MNKTSMLSIVATSILAFVVDVEAHDPAAHTKKIEKPNCETMKDMNTSQMEKNDPVLLAMMSRCNTKPTTMDHNQNDHSRHRKETESSSDHRH